jgi:hypothetical protein
MAGEDRPRDAPGRPAPLWVTILFTQGLPTLLVLILTAALLFGSYRLVQLQREYETATIVRLAEISAELEGINGRLTAIERVLADHARQP